MNEQNLVPTTQRSKSEVRAMQSKGGINSGIARREKRTMQQQMKRLLELAAKDEKGRVSIDPETGEQDIRPAETQLRHMMKRRFKI